jgi:hypothetical protein
VRVGQKSPFPLNRSVSTRTFCKPLILPDVGLLPGPPRIPTFAEISRSLQTSAQLAGFFAHVYSLQRVSQDLRGGFGAFISGREIPFPGNPRFLRLV